MNDCCYEKKNGCHWKMGPKMVIVGHRGACGHAPENTLKSFAKAIELGCQRVELDVHLSEDEVPVVIHDPNLDRTTNGKGPVNRLPLVELKKLDAGEGESIPTLVEVMDFCRGKAELQIELKDPDCPSAVAELIRERQDRKNMVVTSFDLPLLNKFAALMPDVPAGLLNKDPDLDMVTVAREHHHRWICPHFNAVTPELVTEAHQAGLLVYAYHVKDRQIANRLALWGVDAIGTDFPEIASDLSCL
jgi:glycerophosphoryl diester phosphodiesterase